MTKVLIVQAWLFVCLLYSYVNNVLKTLSLKGMENMGILCATFSQAATTRAIGILQGGWIYLLSGKDDGGPTSNSLLNFVWIFRCSYAFILVSSIRHSPWVIYKLFNYNSMSRFFHFLMASLPWLNARSCHHQELYYLWISQKPLA